MKIPFRSLFGETFSLTASPTSTIQDIRPILCESFSISLANLVLVLHGGCLHDAEPLSRLSLSPSDHITVLDRTTTADAVPLPAANSRHSPHDMHRRLSGLRELMHLCPDLPPADVENLLEHCHGDVEQALQLLGGNRRRSAMRGAFDPEMRRFVRRMHGMSGGEYSVGECIALWQIIQDTGIPEEAALRLFERFGRDQDATIAAIEEMQLNDVV
jgi:hypothetical protein